MSFSKSSLGSNFSPEDYRHAHFWISEESKLLINPRASDEDREFFVEVFRRSQEYRGHLWIASSGSTSKKLIGLSKQAFLAAAAGANAHLQSGAFDTWGLCLPEFHVGGLSIWARAHLSRAKVSKFAGEWSAAKAFAWIESERVSLLSLVPTQLFDLMELQRMAPACLRAIVIGGAALDLGLYRRARILDWPILPSFGMTEAGSQVATAELQSLDEAAIDLPGMKILPHLQVQVNEDQRVCLRSPSLMTGFWQAIDGEPKFTAVERDSWFVTSDRGELEDGYLRPLGRESDFVKVKGEGVYLRAIEERLLENPGVQGLVVALPDNRDGHRLIFVVEGQTPTATEQAVKAWNQSAVPVERVSEIRSVGRIPRSELGKVLRARLVEELGRS